MFYSLCSSTMLVINKLAVQANGLPSMVSGAQLTVAAIVPVLLEFSGMGVMGPFERARILPFLVYTTMFATSLYSNMKALMLTNVGAVIAARCCLPLVVCTIEYVFMGRSFPSRRSFASLMGVVCAATVYVMADSGIKVSGLAGIFWLGSWWFLVALQMTYGKFLTDKIVMTQWERVFYNNTLAIPPTVVLYYLTGENRKQVSTQDRALSYLILSCIIGVGISYSGWKCRSVITATTFTLVGVLNKIMSITFTVLLWPENTSITMTLALVTCVAFGLLYEEAPMRVINPGATHAGQAS